MYVNCIFRSLRLFKGVDGAFEYVPKAVTNIAYSPAQNQVARQLVEEAFAMRSSFEKDIVSLKLPVYGLFKNSVSKGI